MGDKNPICTLGDYSKPSYKGYRNTIELPVGNNVVPLRSDTIRLVQNGCSFYGLRSEDPNQHLKDFLKLVDSLDLDGSITTWEDLTTRFLVQFFPPGRTAKLHNDILMMHPYAPAIFMAGTVTLHQRPPISLSGAERQNTDSLALCLAARHERRVSCYGGNTPWVPHVVTVLVPPCPMVGRLVTSWS
ncbi:hypothetical protein Tco_0806630 [Tanacetum coccineum]